MALTDLITPRVTVRELTHAEAPFIVRLLNDPGFIRHIGDRGVRSDEDARGYIDHGPRASYARHGFGLCLVERRGDAAPMGICGLLRRDELDAPDIGFAFLPEFQSQGYAFESASAVLAHARATLGIPRVLAIVNPDNTGSIRLLERLGFAPEGTVTLKGETRQLKLFGNILAR